MLEQRAQQIRLGRIIRQTNEEYGYEDHYPLWAPKPEADSADTLRRTAWEIVMAGGYQTTGETARRGTRVWPDSGGGWMNGRGDDTMTMLEGYAHMVSFFETFPWWTTEPHDELVSSGNYCLAKLGDLYAVYFPHGGPVTLRLRPGRYRGTWFSATTGRTAPLVDNVEGPLGRRPRRRVLAIGRCCSSETGSRAGRGACIDRELGAVRADVKEPFPIRSRNAIVTVAVLGTSAREP